MNNTNIEKIDIDFNEYTNNKSDFTHNELVDIYKQMITDIHAGKFDADKAQD